MEMSHRHGRCCGSCEKDNIIVMWSDNSALSTLIIQQPSVFLARSCMYVCMWKCVCVQMPFPFSTHPLQIRITGNMEKKHLASLCFIVVKAAKLGHSEDTAHVCVAKMKGVAMHECVCFLCTGDYVVFA